MHIGGISTELPLGRTREPEVKTVQFKIFFVTLLCQNDR
jgi:hypothetical protein